MKAIKLLLIFASCFFVIFSCAYAQDQKDPYDIKIKELYSKPDVAAKIIYQIPLDVKMLDVSQDANWYKVAIKFSLGIVEFKYAGWTYIPVGAILAERAEKNKVALRQIAP